MTRSPLPAFLVCALVAGTSDLQARPDVRVWTDPAGDAVIRRTDEGNSAALIPGARLPDLLSVSIYGWRPNTPGGDPYAGVIVPAACANIFRLDIVFAGLLNPPGPIGFDDLPALYGNNPVYGFLDFDVDEDIDTGGQLEQARYSYLEEVARFGCVPTGALAARAVRERNVLHNDVDTAFGTPPQYRRSGADFTLTLCGCTPVQYISGDNGNGIFDSGETWIVRGKFFQRAAGYQCASRCFGGFDIGLYEPTVDLRFKHNAVSNRTIITLVFPLTMEGAAYLGDHDVQDANFTFDFGDDASVYEALSDVVFTVSTPPPDGGADGTCVPWANAWIGRNPADYLNVLNWNATALFGTTYQVHPLGASYVWTDVGFAQVVGDLDGNGVADAADRASVAAYIARADGTADDADGIVNGTVVIPRFAHYYVVWDINGDGVVNSADLALLPTLCPPDWDQQNGLNTSDFFAFLTDFFAGHADFNRDGVTNSADFLEFVAAFFAGC